MFIVVYRIDELVLSIFTIKQNHEKRWLLQYRRFYLYKNYTGIIISILQQPNYSKERMLIMRMNSIAGKIANYGMLIALAFIFSYIEWLFPFSIGIPGVKLGLANIVVLVALYTMGVKEAFIISCVRIILVGFTFGNMFALLYSLAGGVLSWLIMSIMKQIKSFSTIGVSIAGGITHNIGQIIVAAIVLETTSIIGYLPILLIVGTITGLLTGMLGSTLINVQKKAFR